MCAGSVSKHTSCRAAIWMLFALRWSISCIMFPTCVIPLILIVAIFMFRFCFPFVSSVPLLVFLMGVFHFGDECLLPRFFGIVLKGSYFSVSSSVVIISMSVSASGSDVSI